MNTICNDRILAYFVKWINSKRSIDNCILFRSDFAIQETDYSRAIWTNIIINGLCQIGRDLKYDTQPYKLYLSQDKRGQKHNSCFDKPNQNENDIGEFLCDLCWYKYGLADPYWSLEESSPIFLQLALESEWGWLEGGDIDFHIGVVADDFCKLLHIEAQNRLFITCANANSKYKLIEVLSSLRRRAGKQVGEILIWYWDYDASINSITKPEIVRP